MEGQTAAAKEIPPPIQMLQIISGFWVARCVYVVAKLRIADLIKDESKTADELADSHRHSWPIALSSIKGPGRRRRDHTGQ